MTYAVCDDDRSMMLCPEHVGLAEWALLDADECEAAGVDGRYGTWARHLPTGTVANVDGMDDITAWTVVDTVADRNASEWGDEPDDRCAAPDCLR